MMCSFNTVLFVLLPLNPGSFEAAEVQAEGRGLEQNQVRDGHGVQAHAPQHHQHLWGRQSGERSHGTDVIKRF